VCSMATLHLGQYICVLLWMLWLCVDVSRQQQLFRYLKPVFAEMETAIEDRGIHPITLHSILS
jgi:hypothetical protein